MNVHVAALPGVRAFIDFEFNGKGGEILSAAIVTEAGDEWYEVMEYDAATLVPWVVENVIPNLGKEPVAPLAFYASFAEFIRKFGYIEFYFNAHADRRYLDVLLATVENPPLHRCIRDGFMSAKHSAIPHNALADARAIVEYICGSDEETPGLNAGITGRALFAALWRAGYRFDARDVDVRVDSITSHEGKPYGHLVMLQAEAIQRGMNIMQVLHGGSDRVFCEGRVLIRPRTVRSNANQVPMQGELLVPFYFYRKGVSE
ncbi:hypothetical protein D3C87_1258610 [compost metagenome]